MSETQSRTAEVNEKLERVRAYLADRDRSGVLLTDSSSSAGSPRGWRT
jgi:hypothetical protein